LVSCGGVAPTGSSSVAAVLAQMSSGLRFHGAQEPGFFFQGLFYNTVSPGSYFLSLENLVIKKVPKA
jgi:hypothetical protein